MGAQRWQCHYDHRLTRTAGGATIQAMSVPSVPPPAPRRRRAGCVPWLIAGGVAAGAILLLAESGVLPEDGRMLVLVPSLALGVVVLLAALWHRRRRWRETLAHGAIWLGILLALVLAYTWRDELAGVGDRIAAEFLPGHGATLAPDTVRFRAAGDGHFHVRAQVDDVPVMFLVDTGATSVILTPHDARRLGFQPQDLVYSQVFRTADRPVRAAPVRLGEIEIGPLRVTDIPAFVTRSGLGVSLLGMNFLSRLDGWQVEGDTLILRQ